MKHFFALILAVLATALAASPVLAEDNAESLPVAVSILPQKYFVERIGGDRVSVSVMVPPGASAHTFEPRPRQMAALSNTRIYFATGIEFEDPWLPRFKSANPRMRIVHTDEGIDKIAGCGVCGASHSVRNATTDHDPSQEAQGKDPHVWLSPVLAADQARHILHALREEDPANSAYYTRNYVRFLGELGRLEAEIREILPQSGLDGKPAAFLIYHPAYGYFAEDFGLEQIAIEVDGKEPGPRELRQQIDTARERGVRKVFIQPQQSTRAARTVAQALGADVVEVDPYAADWPAGLRHVARLIAESQPNPSNTPRLEARARGER